MAELLRREGFEAVTASDFDSAFSAVENNEVDAALVDIVLPQQSGIAFLKALHLREPYIPVIMMTGEPSISEIPEIVRAGAYDFLSKPVVKDALINAVTKAVEKKRLTDEKRSLERQITQHAEQLELAVAERTRELAEAHDFLNTVLDSSTEHAIIAIDTEGRVTLFNRGAELMFGYSARDAMGKILSELIASHFNPGERPFLSWATRSEVEGRHQEETELRRADQGRIIASVTMTPIRAQTVRPLGYVGIIKDLTTERQNEERLRQMRERLVRNEKIAALGRMAAQVAHEVKNPLAGLRLYSLHLKSRIAGKIAVDEEALVDKIIDGIVQLSDTCERVLSFAHPIKLTPRPVDLNSIIAASLALVEPQLSAKKIKVELNLSESGILALLDEAAMRSTLINLMLNSIQAMNEGGELKVSTAAADQGLRMEIADTGCGMTEEEAKHMFEPFYTTKSRGLGLGLFFAVTIIEHHNGSVEVKSQAGKGTEITITLPLERGKADGAGG
jgi:PAS domain S-box-containing protein